MASLDLDSREAGDGRDDITYRFHSGWDNEFASGTEKKHTSMYVTWVF